MLQSPDKASKSNKKTYSLLSPREEEIGRAIVDAAFVVHKALGPGLLEKIHEACFCHELSKKGLSPERQRELPIVYDGIVFEEGLRCDVFVEDLVICELKAVDEMNPIWQAQLLSHLRLSNRRLGYIINFNVVLIKDGIKRMIV
jgi:GxxExxY protein